MDNQYKMLADALAASASPVFLTGAGMSTESGIPDFRSATGIYSKGVGEEVFDIAHFRRDPSFFYKYARQLMLSARNARPNAGHRAIAALEHEFHKNVTVATQNIDTLHQRAGSTRVHPIHGTLDTCTCQQCEDKVGGKEVWRRVQNGEIPPRHKGCGGILKPDIVFFGEELPYDAVAASEKAISEADLLVVAGTSLVVYPAALLPVARPSSCRLAILNRTPTDLDTEAAVVIRDPLGQTLADAVQHLR
ncbi:MAG: NAD-dependent deacylase [Candidatus Pacebacteria bacterium]|nr:NAD-dependent deacylase [Candidatus Paceibacterota bacterium]